MACLWDTCCAGSIFDLEEHVVGGTDSQYVDASELISSGFVRSPPVDLTCIEGPAVRRKLRLRPTGWGSQKWSLNEWLLPVDDEQRDHTTGFLIFCVNGSYFLAALNENSQLWRDVGCSFGGPGAVALAAGDVVRIGGTMARVDCAAGPSADAPATVHSGERAVMVETAEAVRSVRWANEGEGTPPEVPPDAQGDGSESGDESGDEGDDGDDGNEGADHEAPLLGAGKKLRKRLRRGLRRGLQQLRGRLQFNPSVQYFSKTRGEPQELGALKGELVTEHELKKRVRGSSWAAVW